MTGRFHTAFYAVHQQYTSVLPPPMIPAEEPEMNSQTVAERITGAAGTWIENMPLYAQLAKAQGVMIKDMDSREIQNTPSLAERLRHAGKPQHSER